MTESHEPLPGMEDPIHEVQEPMFEYTADALLKVEMPPLASARMHRLPPYLFGRINTLRSSLRRNGVDIIDLAMGNPNDPTPQKIVDKLNEASGDKRNQRYSVSQGVFNLRRELSKFYQKLWNVSLDPEKEVIATIGSKEGFSHLCLATLGPGDVVLTPTPAFPIHVYSPIIAGANVHQQGHRQFCSTSHYVSDLRLNYLHLPFRHG